MPRRAGRTRTPVPSADSSASSARVSAASWSGWGTTLGRLPAAAVFARRSVSRTDQPRAAASRASARRASLPGAWRIARPWPSLSSPCGEQVEHVVGKVEEADQVRDRRAAAAQPPRQLLLAETQILDQRRAGARLVHGVEVLARHVLDQRGLQALRLGLVPDDRGHRLQAGLPGRPPAALAGDQLVATVAQRADDQRLDDARVGHETRPGVLIESGPKRVRGWRGLRRIELHRQLAQLGLARRALRQDRRQAPAHPGLLITIYLNFSLRYLQRARTDTRSARSRSASSSASSR